jgi:hypothetical protein
MDATLYDALINKYVAPVFRVSGNEPGAFASRVIAPRVAVEGAQFAYREGGTSHLRKLDSRVGARGKAARLDSTFAWVDDAVERHFGASFVPEPIVRALNAQGVDSGEFLANEAQDNMETFMIEEENIIAATMTAHANFTNKTDIGGAWSGSSGDMQKDVIAKIATVKAGTFGRAPNLLGLSDQAYLNALTALRSQNDFGELPTDEILARLFRVEKVIRLTGVYNSAKVGATAVAAELWEQGDASSGAAWLMYSSAVAGRSGKGYANTFIWPIDGQDVKVDQDVLKNPKGVDLLYEMYYKIKVQNELAVYMFYNVV